MFQDNKYGYINASHISATVGSSQRFYIAGQGLAASQIALVRYGSLLPALQPQRSTQLTQRASKMLRTRSRMA